MFFGGRERELELRRAALLDRSASLRREVVERSAVLQPPLRLADGALAGWRWLKAHPDAVVAGVAVVVVVRPRGAWRVARWSWRGWRTWRWLRALALQAQAGFERARRQ